MKNKILIGIAFLLTIIVILVRYEFNKRYALFEKSISQYEASQLKYFRTEKKNRESLLLKQDNKIYQLFTAQFDETKSIRERDTSFSFLYLSNNLRYKNYSFQYVECLNSKCKIDEQNEINQKLIENKISEFKNKYGETFTLWYPKLRDEKLRKIDSTLRECSDYFPNLYQISFDINKWDAFENFMVSYNSTIRESENNNMQVENQFTSNVTSIKNELSANVEDYFERKLSESKSQILTNTTATVLFYSQTLGNIPYIINTKYFNQQALQNIADDAFEEQWKSNSLNNGSTPYSNCYGSYNSCDYGCSLIIVRSGSSDVLVTIKDINGRVVRHGYIAEGHTYSFNIPDGRYEVFFYSGIGWNPHKIMTTNSYGTLRGGFVSNEIFSKDEYISLSRQSMTYELILQQNGNFNTEESSKSDNFN